MDDETDLVSIEVREVCDRVTRLARTLTNADQCGLVLRYEGDW